MGFTPPPPPYHREYTHVVKLLHHMVTPKNDDNYSPFCLVPPEKKKKHGGKQLYLNFGKKLGRQSEKLSISLIPPIFISSPLYYSSLYLLYKFTTRGDRGERRGVQVRSTIHGDTCHILTLPFYSTIFPPSSFLFI